ncbi:hypothetical protein ABBQ32_008720 [Trebouxia sp. C0010 RCD-2024]
MASTMHGHRADQPDSGSHLGGCLRPDRKEGRLLGMMKPHHAQTRLPTYRQEELTFRHYEAHGLTLKGISKRRHGSSPYFAQGSTQMWAKQKPKAELATTGSSGDLKKPFEKQ